MSKSNQATTELMEYICDNICKHLYYSPQGELEEICAKCKVEKLVNNILTENRGAK